MNKEKLQEKYLDDLDELCQTIAQIEHDNHAIIERYNVIQSVINTFLKASEKRNGGKPLASEAAMRKRIDRFKEMLGPVRKPRSVSGQAMKQRLTVGDKLELTYAMVCDFDKRGVERVTLDEINEWLDEPRKQGKNDIRDTMKVRGIHISQVRWFELTIKMKTRDGKMKTFGKSLYSDDCYESKGAGAKSTFNIKKWKKHLTPMIKHANEMIGVKS